MILTVDIGNSNIVIGGVEENEIVFEARVRTETTKTSDQYCVDLKILLDVYGIDTKNIEGWYNAHDSGNEPIPCPARPRRRRRH
jgi:type III pantothenate kinase